MLQYIYSIKPILMTAIELRTEILQLISQEENTSVLEAIKLLLRREDGDTDNDISDEELAELEQQRQDRISGKLKFHSEEESLRIIRQGKKE
ncbi:MAG: hypothetical protein IPP83_05400 [Flavobacteriales bacterium]|nr:hypothetical protein [Flavobacteriales bacterium]